MLSGQSNPLDTPSNVLDFGKLRGVFVLFCSALHAAWNFFPHYFGLGAIEWVYKNVGSVTFVCNVTFSCSHILQTTLFPRYLSSDQVNMYFVRASLEVVALSFLLGITYAQVNDPKSSSTIPTVTALYQTTITSLPVQIPCLITVNDIAFNTCIDASTTAQSSTTSKSPITTGPLQKKCLVTINGIVYNTCGIFLSTIHDSPITMAPKETPSNTLEQRNCLTTENGIVYNTCGLFLSTIRGCPMMMAPRYTPSDSLDHATTIDGRVSDPCASVDTLPCEGLPGCRQLNAPCLTTLTAPEGHTVVVDCGDGFESNHSPTMTSLSSPSSTPTTVCIENRCFDVIGTFGSPASAKATPTQTLSKGEL
jgi:hypothetical protein